MRHHHSFEECLIFFVVSCTSLSFKMIYCFSFLSLQTRREWERDCCSSNTHVSTEYSDCYLYPSSVCFLNFWCSVAILLHTCKKTLDFDFGQILMYHFLRHGFLYFQKYFTCVVYGFFLFSLLNFIIIIVVFFDTLIVVIVTIIIFSSSPVRLQWKVVLLVTGKCLQLFRHLVILDEWCLIKYSPLLTLVRWEGDELSWIFHHSFSFFIMWKFSCA